jgi:hypothetical protein
MRECTDATRDGPEDVRRGFLAGTHRRCYNDATTERGKWMRRFSNEGKNRHFAARGGDADADGVPRCRLGRHSDPERGAIIRRIAYP